MTQPPSAPMPTSGPQPQQSYPYTQQPPQQPAHVDEPPLPTARLVWAQILGGPIGLVALIRQHRAACYWARGDHAAAADWNARARSLTTVAFIAGGVAWGLVILFYLIAMIATVSAATSVPSY